MPLPVALLGRIVAVVRVGAAVVPAVTPVILPGVVVATDPADERTDEIEAIAEEAPADSLAMTLEADPTADEAALPAEETTLAARDEAVAIASEADVAALPAADEALATLAEADVAALPAADEALPTALDPGMIIPVTLMLAADDAPAPKLDAEATAEVNTPETAVAVCDAKLAAFDGTELPTTPDEAALAGGVFVLG